MTYREKLYEDHPNSVNDSFVGGCECCPHDWGYCNVKDSLCGEQRTKKHSNIKCAKCWDRTIPGTEKKIKKLPPDEKKTTWKATYAEFTDGHREAVLYCGDIRDDFVHFVTESGVYVYNGEIHRPWTNQYVIKPHFSKCHTYRELSGDVKTMYLDACYIRHIEFEEVEVDE